MLGSGDAVIGINPVSDKVRTLIDLLHLIDRARHRGRVARRCHRHLDWRTSGAYFV